MLPTRVSAWRPRTADHAIGDIGGNIGAVDIVSTDERAIVRDITVAAHDEAHADAIRDFLDKLDGIEVLHISDRTFLMHLGGKIEVRSKVPGQDARRSLDGLHARRCACAERNWPRLGDAGAAGGQASVRATSRSRVETLRFA